jgi:hypothetical protein
MDKRKMLKTIMEEEDEENVEISLLKPVLSMTKLEMHMKIIELYAVIEVKRILGEPVNEEENLINEFKTILRKRCM